MKTLGENVPGYKIRDMILAVDLDENGTVEFNEFVEVTELCSVAMVCPCSWLHVNFQWCHIRNSYGYSGV